MNTKQDNEYYAALIIKLSTIFITAGIIYTIIELCFDKNILTDNIIAVLLLGFIIFTFGTYQIITLHLKITDQLAKNKLSELWIIIPLIIFGINKLNPELFSYSFKDIPKITESYCSACYIIYILIVALLAGQNSTKPQGDPIMSNKKNSKLYKATFTSKFTKNSIERYIMAENIADATTKAEKRYNAMLLSSMTKLVGIENLVLNAAEDTVTTRPAYENINVVIEEVETNPA